MRRASVFKGGPALAQGRVWPIVFVTSTSDGTQSCPFTPYIFCGCFCVTAAELSRGASDCMARKTQMSLLGPSHRKMRLIPSLYILVIMLCLFSD